jgi:hypothetical protein
MSYGTDLADAYRLQGCYVGRVLKGEKPSGWSVCRVGLTPTGKRRLSTAHTRNRHRVGQTDM